MICLYVKVNRSLCVSFSRTGAGLCIYHLLVWSILNFIHISQWITYHTQLCLVLYSFFANLLHSLIMRLIISFLSPHNPHLLFCWVLSILALILLVRSNSEREINPFYFRLSYLLPLDPYCLCSRGNTLEWYEITRGSANEGWLQIRENKCGNKLPLPEIAVTHSSTYIDWGIMYHPNVFLLRQ